MEDLKSVWDKMHHSGLSAHQAEDIKMIIEKGTTSVVAEINKKIFRDMAITALAAIVSALAVILFYYRYDSIKHPWIDMEKLLPVQVLSFAIFTILAISTYMQYKLVNKSFTADSVKDFLFVTLRKVKKHYRLFSGIIALLLWATYYSLLSYFMNPEGFANHLTIALIGLALTFISHLINTHYWNNAMKSHLEDLNSYLNELK